MVVDALIGQTLGNYRVERLVGKGKMAKVYIAVDNSIGHTVALKIFTIPPIYTDELLEYSRREALYLAKLDHPNIVRIYQYEVINNTPMIAMEYVEGITLHQRLKTLREEGVYMPYAEVERVLASVADVLDFAHRNEVVHCDMKPSNIMFDSRNNRIVITDFGLGSNINNSDILRALDDIFYTPEYISPEQALAPERAVPASDIYSLGVILYEMLTMHSPFPDDGVLPAKARHIMEPPVPPHEFRPQLPPDVSPILLRALAKKPQDRYVSAMEMVEELAQVLSHDSASLTKTFHLKNRGLIFISHATADDGFVEELAQHLQLEGYDTFVDHQNIREGRWTERVQAALEAADKMIVILSKASITSRNVEDEWNYFIEENKAIYTVKIEECPIHFRLRRFQYIDFAVHEFETAFRSLKVGLAQD